MIILHELDDVALRAHMGLPPPEPYYRSPTFPLGLQNLATVFREATESKILMDSEKDLNYILRFEQGHAFGNPIASESINSKLCQKRATQTLP